MFTSLHVQNFKAWRDSGSIVLAPVTILFGTNSAGKSSLTQFLLMLKQTAQSTDQKRPLHFGDANSLVDLGTAYDIAHGHDTSRPIQFELGFRPPHEIEFIDQNSNQTFSGDQLVLKAVISIGETSPELESIRYDLKSGSDIVVRATFSRDKRRGYRLEADHYHLVRSVGRPWELSTPAKFYRPPPETSAFFQNAAFLFDFALEVDRAFARMYYLGPLREYPSRVYTVSGATPDDVGKKGERAIEATIAAKERRLNFAPKTPLKQFDALVSYWLRELGLIESFEVRPIAKNRKEYEVLIKVKGSTNQVALTDVGFGLSQVLPVIVQCFYSEPNSVLIFEQPEIHLHPSVQAGLADLFIATVQAREHAQPRNCQVIIETHSEHLLHRLMRRLAEERIGREDVAAYVIEATGDETAIRPLEIDLLGNISNWPKDFFGDDMADITARLEAAAKRQKTAG